MFPMLLHEIRLRLSFETQILDMIKMFKKPKFPLVPSILTTFISTYVFFFYYKYELIRWNITCLQTFLKNITVGSKRWHIFLRSE